MNLDYFFSGLDAWAYKYMGCHKLDKGVEFYLWAPHAKKVEVSLSRENHKVLYPLEKCDKRGIWHLIIEDCEFRYTYKFHITPQKGKKLIKFDPYAFYSEVRPLHDSIMYSLDNYKFSDAKYIDNRSLNFDKPMNIYEVHINGFKHSHEFTTYKELKETLIPYVLEMGYTHIELMPIIEYPFDGSWGYQATGFFSVNSRYGKPEDLMDFVNECHLNNIGVILDLSFYHFAIDDYALAYFDGKACYESDNPKLVDSQWGTYKFDLSKGPVISFLMSCASMFINEYHFDGLRLDAVSNMIYVEGNKDLGENEDGLEFIKRFNYTIKKQFPDVFIIAEDSTDYQKVTHPIEEGGLGFDYKWDLGWMNDTLRYYQTNPELREYCHNQLTFSMAYFYNEKFILPFSHDEVVHCKDTIINKMYGEYEDKFRQCRNLFIYMFTHPGKKLNFIGNDIGMFREFDEKRQQDWNLLNYPMHDSFHRFFKDIICIYNTFKAFHQFDYDPFSFKWIDADNYLQSIYIYARYDEENCFVVVLNMLGTTYHSYRVGVPLPGTYHELINSDKDIYSGDNICNPKPIKSRKIKAHGLPNSISIDLGPYAAAIFYIKLNKKILKIEEPNRLGLINNI